MDLASLRLMTTGGIAAYVGRTRATVEQSRTLPPPDVTLETGGKPVRAWTQATVDEWWASRPGQGRRTDLP
ncbi:helix-turn-helix transcriptional regulator [Rhodococcoides corynebacterioides]|uniref:helix-turn-helix transcriptional regulator n=1 Tax=Rhodococcoides TaxID=3259750 RepID=UPI001BDED1E8|nr:transcriptional regulator [Rhodococcus kroppenstedtii]MBT1193813.1 transcriptional regulator [Rhodococcus kroppenstedtii]